MHLRGARQPTCTPNERLACSEHLSAYGGVLWYCERAPAPHLIHGIQRRSEEVVADHVAAHDAADNGAAVKPNSHDDRRAVRRLERRAQLLHLQGEAGEGQSVLLQRPVHAGNAARRRDEGVPGEVTAGRD